MLHEVFGLVDTIKIEAKKARELAELQIKLHEGIIMMLTEEEKESITRLKFKSDTYSLITLGYVEELQFLLSEIDRLETICKEEE